MQPYIAAAERAKAEIVLLKETVRSLKAAGS
jgi:hypothetical protein